MWTKLFDTSLHERDALPFSRMKKINLTQAYRKSTEGSGCLDIHVVSRWQERTRSIPSGREDGISFHAIKT